MQGFHRPSKMRFLIFRLIGQLFGLILLGLFTSQIFPPITVRPWSTADIKPRLKRGPFHFRARRPGHGLHRLPRDRRRAALVAAVPLHRVRHPLPPHAHRQRLPLLRHDLLLRQVRRRRRRRQGAVHDRGVRPLHQVVARIAVRIQVNPNSKIMQPDLVVRDNSSTVKLRH